jgi:hypothetical protein
MQPNSLPTELILTQSQESLGRICLDWIPQPGNYLNFQGQTYTILERRHRYQLKSGRYQLHKISLYVQFVQQPEDRTLIDGNWILGDANCRFNAHSELIRCAVNPLGLCQECRFFEPI